MPSDPFAPPPGSSGGRFVTPRRLHPASVVAGVDLRQLVQGIAFPAAAAFAAGGVFLLGLLAFFAVVGLGYRILAWQRFTFAFDGDVLRVEEGVLGRKARSLDVARIQQVELDRPVLQRAIGLATVRVETAGSSAEVEVELRALTRDDAEALRAELRARKASLAAAGVSPAGAPADPAADVGATPAGADDPFADPTRDEILRVPLGHVVLAAVTGVRLLVFPAVIAGALQVASEAFSQRFDELFEVLIDRGLVQSTEGLRGLGLTGVLVLVVGVLAASLVTAIVVGVLRDANYTVTRVGDDLHVARGLASTRDSVLPLRRLQLVEVRRNWLRRALGYGAVRLHSAGGSGDADRRVTVPLLAETEVDGFLAAVLPGVAGIPELTPHPPQARRRAVLRALRPAASLTAIVWAVHAWTPLTLPTFVLGLASVLPVVAIGLGIVEHRHLAHALTERVVVARSGALSTTTAVAPVVKVQAASLRTSYFQRRLRLATVTAHVAGPGGDVVVLDAGRDDGDRLRARLTEHAAHPVPVALEPSR